MNNLYNFIKTYEIWIFLLFAPITSAIFVYGVHLHLIPGRLYLHGRFFVLLFLLIGMVKLTRGNAGLKDLFKPMLIWKVPLRWYLFAFFFASSIACLTLYLRSLYLGVDFTDFTLNFSYFSSFYFTFNIILFALVGEVVWVSFAVRELSKIMNPFFASQIVGAVWTLWWIPIVIMNDGVIEDLPIVALMINMMGAAGMCAFIYGKTKSGICVWVLQIMLNSSCLIFPVSPRSDVTTYWAFSIVYFLVMLVFMFYFYGFKNSIKIKIYSQ
ncbi:hypothetical protein C3L50_11060 [Flavobacterium alvei]|uniref:CPBP family intramembrane metalloprotease n=1 Tax=Flavobacterium alvei TaxID=2080416 RepID=A0A2S5A7Z4_9FLAO|nr:hypothetical protein [Flavobacterium alvei]POY38675.1 hypothetical protein C3L50_11060 [Flavobacterium alvei]